MAALLGLFIASVLPRTYTAQSELFFAVEGGSSITEFDQAASLVRSQMTSYAELATSRSVLEEAARELGLSTSATDLAEQVTAVVPLETVVLKVKAESGTPEHASALANAVAAQVSEQVAVVSPRLGNGQAIVKPSVVTAATPPPQPSWPSKVMFTGIGGFAGLLLGSILSAILFTQMTAARGRIADNE